MVDKIYNDEIEGIFDRIEEEIKISSFGHYRTFYIDIFGTEIKLIVDQEMFKKFEGYFVKGAKIPVYKIKKGVESDKEYFRFDKKRFKEGILKNG